MRLRTLHKRKKRKLQRKPVIRMPKPSVQDYMNLAFESIMKDLQAHQSALLEYVHNRQLGRSRGFSPVLMHPSQARNYAAMGFPVEQWKPESVKPDISTAPGARLQQAQFAASMYYRYGIPLPIKKDE